VGAGADQQRQGHRRPGDLRQARRLWFADQTTVEGVGQQAEDGVFEKEVEEQIGEQADRQAEPEQARQAVTLAARDCQRQEVGQVGREAANDQRRRDAPAAHQARQGQNGGRVGGAEGHGGMIIDISRPRRSTGRLAAEVSCWQTSEVLIKENLRYLHLYGLLGHYLGRHLRFV